MMARKNMLLKIGLVLFFAVAVVAPPEMQADMVMYDDFSTGLDLTNTWDKTGTVYPRSGGIVELACGYEYGQIVTKTADFTLPALAEVGGSLTVQVNYQNKSLYSHGYINICQFDLLGVDGTESYAFNLRRDVSTGNWMWWNNDTSAWAKTNVAVAAPEASQLVRMTVTNVGGNLVQSASVSNDSGTSWVQVFTDSGQSAVWPEAVKLRLYENWRSCIIDDVQYENVVPEPATLALLGLGGFAAMFKRKNR